MKREIKFRAWLLGEHQMSYSDNWFFMSPDGSCIQYADQGYWVNMDPKEYLEEHNVPIKDDFILMQFTGLKDKNGVEIFEGDIVRFLDGSYVSTENGIDTNEFMSVGKVEWCDERKGWDVTNREDVQTDECFDEYMEVIGNIYQNPELLKS